MKYNVYAYNYIYKSQRRSANEHANITENTFLLKPKNMLYYYIYNPHIYVYSATNRTEPMSFFFSVTYTFRYNNTLISYSFKTENCNQSL